VDSRPVMAVKHPRPTPCQSCHIKRDPAEAPVW